MKTGLNAKAIRTSDDEEFVREFFKNNPAYLDPFESPRSISLNVLSDLGWQPSKRIIAMILEENGDEIYHDVYSVFMSGRIP